MTQTGRMPPPKSPGFEANLRTIPIDAILPVKQLPVTVTKSQKYGQIAASIREVGLIEPPVVVVLSPTSAIVVMCRQAFGVLGGVSARAARTAA